MAWFSYKYKYYMLPEPGSTGMANFPARGFPPLYDPPSLWV